MGMVKQKLSLQEQLKALDKRKDQLLDKRRKEILNIIEQTKSLEINDQILAGTLLFLHDDKNKTHPILEEFKKYLKPKRAAHDKHKKIKAAIPPREYA